MELDIWKIVNYLWWKMKVAIRSRTNNDRLVWGSGIDGQWGSPTSGRPQRPCWEFRPIRR